MPAFMAREKVSGPRPQRRSQTSLGGQRLDDAALCDIGQKFQGAIEVGLAAAVRAGHDVECAERHSDVAQGTIAGDGKSGHHNAATRIDGV